MTPAELREDVVVELEALEAIVQELLSLHADVVNRYPTVREQTAAAAFLAQFYNGVENSLKRISVYHNVPLPRKRRYERCLCPQNDGFRVESS